jgi:hypothetical protein
MQRPLASRDRGSPPDPRSAPSLQHMLKTEYGCKEANVFHIKLCLENHLTYLIFERFVVKCSLIFK